MVFIPADISATCHLYPSVPTCQPSVLAFMAFLAQNFGNSYDGNFTDSKFNNHNDNEEYDFIVVGGGTGGCVVANRLSEIYNWTVLVLEAGDEEPVIADVPGFYRSLTGSNFDWKYSSQPELVGCTDYSNNGCPLARGKLMGGSSSLNGLAYVRGNKEDYNDWARLGNTGWSYKDVLPYFLKSEDNRDMELMAKDAERHSTDGYLTVQSFPYDDKNNDVIVNAWKELDLKHVDYNGQHQLGVSHYQTTSIHGARQSSNGAFIRPIRGRRPNLVIRTKSYATKIIIEPESKRAVGVEYSVDGDRDNLRKVHARKEVIVSAGIFESPKLLMLSGIGHADELTKSGIKVIQNLAVGDNLQDHVMIPASVAVFDQSGSTVVSSDAMQNDAVYWLNTHEGPVASIGSIPSTMAFTQTRNEQRHGVPDIQVYHFNMMIEDIEASKNYNGLPSYYPAVYYNAFVITPVVLNPKSRGTVRLNTSDPTWSPPLIKLNQLTNPRDMKTMVDGAMIAKRLFETRTFKERNITKYEQPPASCESPEFESPEYFECIAKYYAKPGLHLVGTCKMGPKGDRTAVVDPRLRVKGIKGLRVIDASIMPIVPKGNSYAPTIMIGEKGSDMIKEDWLE